MTKKLSIPSATTTPETEATITQAGVLWNVGFIVEGFAADEIVGVSEI